MAGPIGISEVAALHSIRHLAKGLGHGPGRTKPECVDNSITAHSIITQIRFALHDARLKIRKNLTGDRQQAGLSDDFRRPR